MTGVPPSSSDPDAVADAPAGGASAVAAPAAAAEEKRLAALRRYNILDTPREQNFDDIVRLASELIGVPMAAVSLVDEVRQWFKAEIGLGMRETPRELSFCAHSILSPDSLTVPDASTDPRFVDNALVTGNPNIRFYAGENLLSADGIALGTLCIIDTKPWPQGLSDSQKFILRTLAGQVANQLELRRALAERDLALTRHQRSEFYKQQILDSSIDHAIISMDLEGCVTSWSAGAEHILGWSEQEMRGETIARIFTPEDCAIERPAKEMRLALDTGRGNDERRHIRKNGAYFFATGVMTPLRDADGTVIGFVKIFRDRTEERRKELRLAILAQAAADLLAAADPEAVFNLLLRDNADILGFDQLSSFLITPNGEHLRVVSAFGFGTVADLEDLDLPIAGSLAGRVAQTRRPVILAGLQTNTDPHAAAARAAGTSAFAGFPVLVDNHLFGVLSFGSRLREAFDSEEIAFFATLASYLAVVRSRLHREAELRRLAATLEQRVEMRTAERKILEEQLRQSQKMEAVGQLTGGLAHDFNNLLTGISGALQLMKTRRAQNPAYDIERYIDIATSSTDRAAALTHRLLAFSRRQTLAPKATSVSALISGLRELVERTVGPAIALRIALADPIWTALCDPHQLENALLNLCINARDAMPAGGTLRIEAANTHLDAAYTATQLDLAPGDYIAIAVTDTGTGMPAAVAARIFDPFFTTKPMGSGTGLGLSMVYGFAKQSGGHIRVETAEGAGTTMRLYLPRHDGEIDAIPASDDPRAQKPVCTGETVLIVDDEPMIRELVLEILLDLGYAALHAADGPEAMRIITSAARIDLLITDVGLPNGMNGRQIADAARQNRPALPVLFITGYAENAVIGGGQLDAGMEVIAKPFGLEAMTSRIREMLLVAKA
jgi:PAS domain S-box-containing protein